MNISCAVSFYYSPLTLPHIVYESYARSPRDELNMTPKEPGDFRERVERETIRG
jgi:hypothetical protein